MFHQPEKYDSDSTDTLLGFNAGRQGYVCVCAVDMCEPSVSVCMPENDFVYIMRREGERERKKAKKTRKKK